MNICQVVDRIANGQPMFEMPAAQVFPLTALGADGWKVAAALAARHIGGAVNYVAGEPVGQTIGAGRASCSHLWTDQALFWAPYWLTACFSEVHRAPC